MLLAEVVDEDEEEEAYGVAAREAEAAPSHSRHHSVERLRARVRGWCRRRMSDTSIAPSASPRAPTATSCCAEAIRSRGEHATEAQSPSSPLDVRSCREASTQSEALALGKRCGSSSLTARELASACTYGVPAPTRSSCQHPINASPSSRTSSGSCTCLSSRSVCQSTNATWQIAAVGIPRDDDDDDDGGGGAVGRCALR